MHRCRNVRLNGGDNIGTKGLFHGFADNIQLLQAKPFLACLVVEANAPVRPNIADRQTYVVGNKAELSFAINDLLFELMIALDVGNHHVNASHIACRGTIGEHAHTDVARLVAWKTYESLVGDSLARNCASREWLRFQKLLLTDYFCPVFANDLIFALIEPVTCDLIHIQIAQAAIRFR